LFQLKLKAGPMATWKIDPSFYPSPRQAARAQREALAYVATLDPDRNEPDAIAVVDLDPASPTYSRIVGTTSMPNAGDELHHFGWNACSSCLCPNHPHPHEWAGLAFLRLGWINLDLVSTASLIICGALLVVL
jgi:56kDa selenium binding protein (SBP56)